MPTAFAPLTRVIRALAMDAVQQVNFVHPGMPMGMPDIAEVHWRCHLRHNPPNPDWPELDRPVLSNGHGSMPIITLLHLGSNDVLIDEPQNFHQFVSKTPVHPEVDHPPGVETTTGQDASCREMSCPTPCRVWPSKRASATSGASMLDSYRDRYRSFWRVGSGRPVV